MSARLCILSLLASLVLLYVGTHKARNRRKRGVLPAPHPKCCGERNATECVGKVS